ncbi:MAG: DUF4286 family protein [Alphaproteobacteria bacterium]|nr:DUF4286 family protein [Alphaproteobacteria bacterium]
MDQAGAIYLVRFWIDPDAVETVLDWLDRGHIADVIDEPGFLWARRVRLANEDAADNGWPGFAMIYAVDSVESLESYFDSDAAQRFAAERAAKGLDTVIRMERDWGRVEFAAESDLAEV